MTGLGLLLLTALMHGQHALALQCHTCFSQPDVGQCMPLRCLGDQKVCFTGSTTVDNSLGGGGKVKLYHKGCAPSCEIISQTLSPKAETTKDLGSLGLGVTPQFEMQDVTCCYGDLCNGVAPVRRSLWALAAGLLLSLGLALL